ncbi:MAG: glyoxylase-like metal-dependent hydrolase (beta-lactamase superfamily II) [Verrucomicrobiales bacterium]|jgi:glyoxylase-like metal-dependent hydrolase (beta-lactamase superfamily II)
MIHTIDLEFTGVAGSVAAFLVETPEGELVLVETGPHSTLANLKAGVAATGHAFTDIQHVLVTHIHLDHAGAAWALAEHGAKIYVHPFGLKHLGNPERLMASAGRIYGNDMDRLWGRMQPIPEEQLVPALHEQLFRIGGRSFSSFHTPGHACHHIAWMLGEEILFTGDVAGVRVSSGPVQPPCPPPDIDLREWRQSIKLLRKLPAQRLFLTHFGEMPDKEAHLDELYERLVDWSEWVALEMRDGQIIEDMIPAFQRYVESQLREADAGTSLLAQYDAANPAFMSVSGLVRYWQKEHERQLPGRSDV